MKECIIVIPIYKEVLDNNELISFQQCLKVLKNWDISIITYKELDTSFYTPFLEESKVQYQFTYFDQSFFQNVHGYNQLMVDKQFYKTYNTSYKYLMIYQLDCFIFEDQVQKWCARNYSYIGAPWPHGPDNEPVRYKHVGNGGLSLRKIEDHIRVIDLSSSLPKCFLSFNFAKRLKNWYAYIRLKNKNSRLFKNNYKNEDMFFGKNSTYAYSFFTAPGPKEALLFSIESRPRDCVAINNILPMGTHAWPKFDIHFWAEHIKPLGYNVKKPSKKL
ncbi:DUF5672 family protein [Flammeovirga aprica]|uniref:DUF5672 domain-containing protein n=1 Tax=Flammeovirga aprica JL-4 TaxID=694437 RepID=A0A7X9S1K8_9BACT|nr:DUF5672 family protein [Flammeovirga aprica]NME72621.1 hypothetical protein [Flammeovirga aprica JL-4]